MISSDSIRGYNDVIILSILEKKIPMAMKSPKKSVNAHKNDILLRKLHFIRLLLV